MQPLEENSIRFGYKKDKCRAQDRGLAGTNGAEERDYHKINSHR